ncbi:hypothetical protein [Ornithinimicrobium cerasi]|uniref:hypothetical protein n=1 Tax=Ornithinimicrobium cerasi TaxID=2248773 RepID=UPI0014825B13|nr:hypothetical protein [Ornithinimicrobium cerasi]
MKGLSGDRPTALVSGLVERTAVLLERAGPLIMTTVTSTSCGEDAGSSPRTSTTSRAIA